MALLKLITAPVSVPVSGLLWVAETVQKEAEREYHNVDKIRQQIADIEARIRSGELGEEEGDELTGQWLERLIEARRYHASKR